jgi:hypothetical protein
MYGSYESFWGFDIFKRWIGVEGFAFRGSISPVYEDVRTWIVKVSGAAVEGRLGSEKDEVLLFWNETKAKLRGATETHLRLMIKQQRRLKICA